jgi:hypothetical protein
LKIGGWLPVSKNNPFMEEKMEEKIQEIAAVLRSTDDMALKFTERVQERLGQPVTNDEILHTMESISPSRLTMDELIRKMRRKLELN